MNTNMSVPLPTRRPRFWPYNRIIKSKQQDEQRFALVEWTPMWVTKQMWKTKSGCSDWWLVDYTGYIKKYSIQGNKLVIHWKNSWIHISESE